MKRMRWMTILLAVIIMTGVCGCMNNSENTEQILELRESDVLNYLTDKYGESFEITKFSREFDGKHGVYYRVVFNSDNHPENGVLYCYAEGYGNGDKVIIGGVECIVADDYANVILQAEYAAMLQSELGDGVMVKCRLETPNSQITNEDLAAGVQSCLENADLRPHLYVFVFADTTKRSEEFKRAAETLLGQHNVFKQYLYIGYQAQMNFAEWEKAYRENAKEFEIFLVEESDMDVIEFSSFKLDEGLSKSYVVKE